MSALVDWVREFFTRVKPLPVQMQHYQSRPDEPAYRLHLRVDRDGTGILIVNASTVLHLNRTATEYAHHMMKGTTPEQIAGIFASRYRVNRTTALRDYTGFRDRIQTLIHTPDLDPTTYLDFERIAPHSQKLSAPLRLDCALTYHLPRDTKAEYAPVKRVDRELTTEEWKRILDIAWQSGIPHITFTGGEPTLRDDLIELIAHAEKNGQVCGLFSDGLKLADKKYLQSLLQSGLDHLLFLLQPEKDASWKALSTILPEDLYTTVHFTLTPKSEKKAENVLEKLAKMGANSLSLSTSDASLREALKEARIKAAHLGLTLRWDLPVPYSAENPVALETVEDKVPGGAGRTWLYVEPDGDVLAGQGMTEKILGNLLRDKWQTIYH